MDYRHTAYIGVGSNLGNKADNCRKGITAIDRCEGCMVEAQSPLYETEPVYLEHQDWFVNGVAKIRTDLGPEVLFAQLKAIEHAMGRRPGEVRFGPRILDLDILFYDDCILRTELLQIPHPRLHERRFVLRPLCNIAPDLVHPMLGQTVRSLLEDLKDGGKRVRSYKCDF
ncbi:MAG: 2-amino-4-hydroxy-6-hydroxymethyldihydropteridine diphosphokinase [Deltaproteobacteria bacterium]|nr:2-amino-4-hydroxy-6-hydroxymethyldihydropteridine diphosphokinase [Deltaproteobacteria bacterium]MBW2020427.1 2-amino-4-hydroxy-6-hydroxymethyldihydropteridine diphosphokinase [Deltaproteobacteria bacterium]MBW2075171.1 2-amino-4-hydroxy-6-hydroxymethyldihydropteridine diphosphokinase [Deltaproteobacteria bacterium]